MILSKYYVASIGLIMVFCVFFGIPAHGFDIDAGAVKSSADKLASSIVTQLKCSPDTEIAYNRKGIDETINVTICGGSKCKKEFTDRVDSYLDFVNIAGSNNQHIQKSQYIECVLDKRENEFTCGGTTYGNNLKNCCIGDPFLPGKGGTDPDLDRSKMTRCCVGSAYTSNDGVQMCCPSGSSLDQTTKTCSPIVACKDDIEAYRSIYTALSILTCTSDTPDAETKKSLDGQKDLLQTKIQTTCSADTTVMTELRVINNNILALNGATEETAKTELCAHIPSIYTDNQCVDAMQQMTTLQNLERRNETIKKQLIDINKVMEETSDLTILTQQTTLYNNLNKEAKKNDKDIQKFITKNPENQAISARCQKNNPTTSQSIAQLAGTCQRQWLTLPIPLQAEGSPIVSNEILSPIISDLTDLIANVNASALNMASSYKTQTTQENQSSPEIVSDIEAFSLIQSDDFSAKTKFNDGYTSSNLSNIIAICNDPKLLPTKASADALITKLRDKQQIDNGVLISYLSDYAGLRERFCTIVTKYSAGIPPAPASQDGEKANVYAQDNNASRTKFWEKELDVCQSCSIVDKNGQCCPSGQIRDSVGICHPAAMVVDGKFCANGVTDGGQCIVNDYGSMGIHCSPSQLVKGTCRMDTYKLLQIRQSNQRPNPGVFIQDIVFAATSFIGVVATISLLASGLYFVFGGVKDSEVEMGRQGIRYAIIGIILVAFSYTIIRLVQYIAMGR